MGPGTSENSPETREKREEREGREEREVGVGPWEGPWPEDPRYDPELLRDGDRRNVVDGYRYWTLEAIVADLDARRHPFTWPSRTGSTT